MGVENYPRIKDEYPYNSLRSPEVWDNAMGNASIVNNKTSIWITCEGEILRICNISMDNVDGIDEISIQKDILSSALEKINIDETTLYMNTGLLCIMVKEGLVEMREDGAFYFDKAICRIDKGIKNNEKTVS